ncbi:MAG: hypothetical protein VB096_09670 [Pseudoflavonifractor sp.]|nr:hypothetical protein [Pseudoflavonifractor sp.]
MSRRVTVTNKSGETNAIVADDEFIAFLVKAGATVSELEPSTISPPAHTEMEKLRADVDFLAAMGGINL